MSKLEERNIYDLVIIIYDGETHLYVVMNIQDITCWHTIWSGKDLDTAIEIKKAYCFGYIDRKNEESE